MCWSGTGSSCSECFSFFFQAEDGIRDLTVTGVQTCALPILTITLPDLGPSFSAQPITAGNSQTVRATAGRFTVTPGVYVLSADALDVASLPAKIGRASCRERV